MDEQLTYLAIILCGWLVFDWPWQAQVLYVLFAVPAWYQAKRWDEA